jgi:hypothetical protein
MWLESKNGAVDKHKGGIQTVENNHPWFILSILFAKHPR